ncbi:MAG: glycoside hydrolase family 16 protein [Akkermansia sp.]|nr:glycoside hydrolase family 16 protein [Akkermansia sp.]
MMKTLLSAMVLAALPLTAAPDKAPRELEGGWVYEWGDEFNGNKLNTKKWAYELGVVRNPGASQAYTKKSVAVKNGKLIITSRAQETPNCNYREGSDRWFEKIKTQPFASGSVTTRNVKHFEAPGRLEFRARIPRGKGVWPAIWTMHVNNYGWPANGEIDILEHISQEPETCYCIFRWGRNGGNQEQKVIRTRRFQDYSKKFHTYVLEWDDKIMRILIDDEEVGRVNIADANYPNGDNPLRTPCYIIINTAIGGHGTWPEMANPKDYPVRFEIDYVRYYTKKK